MLPSAALIQPWRGAPPEPLGDGTQASFQPSLKSVEHGNGRQSVRIGLAADRFQDHLTERVHIGATVPGCQVGGQDDFLDRGDVGEGGRRGGGGDRLLGGSRARHHPEEEPGECSDDLQDTFGWSATHIAPCFGASRRRGLRVEERIGRRPVDREGATHSNAVTSFIGNSGAATSAGTMAPCEFKGGASIARTANPLGDQARDGERSCRAGGSTALLSVAEVVSNFGPGAAPWQRYDHRGKQHMKRGLSPSLQRSLRCIQSLTTKQAST